MKKIEFIRAISNLSLLYLLMNLIFIFSACNKLDQTTIVKGKVTDPFTLKPIKNASVILWDSSFLSFSDELIAETKTDSNGNYLISVDESTHFISLGDRYTDTTGKIREWQCGLLSIEYGKSNVVDFTDFSPIGSIIFKMNVNQKEFDVKVEVYDEKMNYYWKDYFYWNKSEFESNLYYTTSDVRANDSILILITKNKNGVKTEQTFRHYVDAFQVDTLELIY
jgi:hypothetical protein